MQETPAPGTHPLHPHGSHSRQLGAGLVGYTDSSISSGGLCRNPGDFISDLSLKAEILLFEQSQQLQLRPIRKLSRQSREEPDLAGFFWGPRQVAGDPVTWAALGL